MNAQATNGETFRGQMTTMLDAYGITAHADDDAGNSWLAVPLDVTSNLFPGMDTPHLVVHVYDEGEDWVVVDAPLEHPSGAWQVTVGSRVLYQGAGVDPAAETAECAEFVADYLTAPAVAAA